MTARKAFSARSASPSTRRTSPRKNSYAADALVRRRGEQRALGRARVARGDRVAPPRRARRRPARAASVGDRAPSSPAPGSSCDRARRPRAPTPRRRRAPGRARAIRRRSPDPRARASARARARCAPAADSRFMRYRSAAVRWRFGSSGDKRAASSACTSASSTRPCARNSSHQLVARRHIVGRALAPAPPACATHPARAPRARTSWPAGDARCRRRRRA